VEAGTLSCSGCGAAVSPELARCPYCDARLATIRCPSCFGMVFSGATHCPHCGSRALAPGPAETVAGPRSCPGCATPLEPTAFGSLMTDACPRCAGIWLDTVAFEQVCRDKELDATVFAGSPVVAQLPCEPAAPAQSTRARPFYVRCPVCHTMMNRVNFIEYSGVIVDVCKGHGTWFDRDELRRVVEFLRAGGMAKALERQRKSLEQERARLEQARARLDHARTGAISFQIGRDATTVMGFVDLIDLLFR
jgi:Zn-finger nucleic acid-binding protein